MDPFGSILLLVVVAAAFLYALYWVIRRAVGAALRDARAQQAGAEIPPRISE
ncbi:MAG: hypothetical protein HY996_10425 [Micrococcales bacterium]|nr:hypothetical protein [Micrococcales bacterium]